MRDWRIKAIQQIERAKEIIGANGVYGADESALHYLEQAVKALADAAGYDRYASEHIS